MTSSSYKSLLSRRAELMRRSVGIDYERFHKGGLAWDYEGLMGAVGYGIEEAAKIQLELGVGRTPMREAPNLTALVRAVSPEGKGARIFLKDEAANPSGSFKDRRASLSVHEARERGFRGVIAATSGNYGAAVASQAARAGLACIVVQEAFDREDPGLLEGIDLCRGDTRSLHGVDHAGLDGDPVQRAGLVSVGVEEQRVVWPRVPTEFRTKRPELLLKGLLDSVVVEVKRRGHAKYPLFRRVEAAAATVLMEAL